MIPLVLKRFTLPAAGALGRGNLAAGTSRSVTDFLCVTNTIAPQTGSSCYQRSLSQSETGTEGIQDFLIVSRSDSTLRGITQSRRMSLPKNLVL